MAYRQQGWNRQSAGTSVGWGGGDRRGDRRGDDRDNRRNNNWGRDFNKPQYQVQEEKPVEKTTKCDICSADVKKTGLSYHRLLCAFVSEH